MGFHEFSIDPTLLSENQQAKLTRIQKVATHKLMIAYLQDQVENVLANLDGVLHDDAIIKMMLIHLIKNSEVACFSRVMGRDELDQRTQELEKYLLEEIDGINYLVSDFNFDKCMDLL